MDDHPRDLLVTADDFGIGPATSAGILDAAAAGVITSSVLLVNSPHAENAVHCWRQRGCPMELGWHPNLTLDAPVLPRSKVPSLIMKNGNFWPLAAFLRRLLLGRLRAQDMALELAAQLARFRELTTQDPAIVNTHQHIGVFAPVDRILLDVLEQNNCFPVVRRVREKWSTVWRVPGARMKRVFLNSFGHAQKTGSHPVNDWLAGISDPKRVKNPDFFGKWLRTASGRTVELMCHPGHWDDTLVGRDARHGDGLQQRRVDELHLLRLPGFLNTVRDVGYSLIAPSKLASRGLHRAAA